MDENDKGKFSIERVKMVKDIGRANYSPQQYIYMPNAVMRRHRTSQQTPDAEAMLKKSTLAQHVLEVQTGNKLPIITRELIIINLEILMTHFILNGIYIHPVQTRAGALFEQISLSPF